MKCAGRRRIWQLAPGQTMRLDGARGTRLEVTRGTLWITLEHDVRDIVVERGSGFTIDRGGLTLAEAQSDTSVAIEGRDADRVYIGMHRSLRDCLAAWFREMVDSTGRNRGFVPYY